MVSIVVYSKPSCPYCTMAKQLLAQKGQEWAEIDIEEEPGRREEMIERSGQRTVPQIFIDDHHVGGFDELAALEDAGELDTLLDRERTAPGETEHRRVVIVGSGPAGIANGVLSTGSGGNVAAAATRAAENSSAVW